MMAQPGGGLALAYGGAQKGAQRPPVTPGQLQAPAAHVPDTGDCDPVRLEDLACPVCFETLTDPFVTACGHSFCYACISRHLEAAKNCPSCSHYLSADLIHPNFLLNKIVKRARSRAPGRAVPPLELVQQAISDHASSLGEPDVDALLRLLWGLKQGLQERQREASMELLLHFLQSSRHDKVQRLTQLQKELLCLDGDIKRVEAAGVVPTNSQARPGSAAGEAAAAAAPGSPGARVPQQPPPKQEEQQQQQQQQVQRLEEAAGVAPAAAAMAGAVGAAGSAAAAAAHASGVAALQHFQLLQQQQQQQQQGAAGAPLPAAAMAAALGMHVAHHPPSPGMFGSLLSPAMTSTTTTSAGGGVSSSGRPRDVLSLLRNKKRRIASQFDDLQQCYLQLRTQRLQAQAAAGGTAGGAAAAAAGQAGGVGQGAAGAAGADDEAAAAAVGPLIDEGLQEFSRLLSVITRCNKLRLVAEVPRPTHRHHGSSSIISSLEFDRDGALFATAGVSKRISIYEFAGVAPHHSCVAAPPLPGGAAAVRSGAAPVVELLSRSKLSCLSWNKYIQSHIASSDYEGVVSVWDVGSATLLHEYEAHSKRIWSVDFCGADPTLLASGSDDCAVKFWSTKCPSSVAQVDTAANVCAVRWRPGSSHDLAVGSADHSVCLYDLRNTSAPVRTFQGHRKAVSYVRFCSASELVSASTDSTLRLWTVDDPAAAAAVPGEPGAPTPPARSTRVYEGHSNEKNFVGLAVEGDFLACGSETSELFVYYKALSKPVAQQAFAAHGEDGGEAQSDKGFISAVCWRPGAQALLAANSQGTVKVFSLTGSHGQA